MNEPTPDHMRASAPTPAFSKGDAKKVVVASEPPASHNAVVTATVYVDAQEFDAPAADAEEIGSIRVDRAQMDGHHVEQFVEPQNALQDPSDLVDVDEVEERSEQPPADDRENVHVDSLGEMPGEQWVEVGGEQAPLTSLLESLLFVSDAALEPEQVAKVLPCTVEQIEIALQRLSMLYKVEGRGLRVQERSGRYLLVTMPIAAPVIESFLNLDLETRLSGPALEALAVIAYRQPVTRSQIEAVRGVDCGHVLRVLLQHELIEEAGRLETAGRPILYGVTDRFLQHFGLTSIGELPKLETSEADMLWAATQLAEDAEH